jgi:hypothetical protein
VIACTCPFHTLHPPRPRRTAASFGPGPVQIDIIDWLETAPAPVAAKPAKAKPTRTCKVAAESTAPIDDPVYLSAVAKFTQQHLDVLTLRTSGLAWSKVAAKLRVTISAAKKICDEAAERAWLIPLPAGVVGLERTTSVGGAL